MRSRKRGFTLVEVLITLVVLMLVMSAVSAFFLGVIRQFKQQSRIAQSGMDSVVGLEMLRRDIEHAGFGLPWNDIPGYAEAASGTAETLNDSPNDAPRGIVSADGGGWNNSDYLAIKASNVAMNDASRKWTTLRAGDVKRTWTTVPADAENLAGTDRVIVMSPGSDGANWRSLVTAAGAFSTTYDATSDFAPGSSAETRVIYGIDDAIDPRMPFNRADYFIDTTSVPQRCAPNTGVLVKAVVRHSDGALDTPMPLLDCVATMNVQYMLDTDGDGEVNATSTDISFLNAQEVRDQLRQVRVSVLAHEGQRDPNYTHAAATIPVGGTSLDIGANANYRWKVYTVDVTPENLRD
jgi:prepilin-type N-terminal cleavage/methylation domain-containing protein